MRPSFALLEAAVCLSQLCRFRRMLLPHGMPCLRSVGHKLLGVFPASQFCSTGLYLYQKARTILFCFVGFEMKVCSQVLQHVFLSQCCFAYSGPTAVPYEIEEQLSRLCKERGSGVLTVSWLPITLQNAATLTY